MSNKNKNRFRVSYPFKGKVFYANSINKVVPLCFKDFVENNDIPEGFFKIENLDNRQEFQFKKQNKNIKKIIPQDGGFFGMFGSTEDNNHDCDKDDCDKEDNNDNEVVLRKELNNTFSLLLDEIKKMDIKLENLKEAITPTPIEQIEQIEKNQKRQQIINDINKVKLESYKANQKPEPIIRKQSAENIYNANSKKLEATESLYKKNMWWI